MTDRPRNFTILDGALLFLVLVSLAVTVNLVVQRILFDLTKDTTELSNSGVILMIAFTALAFTYAQVVTDEKDKKNIIMSGELFFLGLLLFAFASILKFTSVNSPHEPLWFRQCLNAFFPLLFFVGTAAAHVGVAFLLIVVKQRVVAEIKS